jgi:hypothetical protein
MGNSLNGEIGMRDNSVEAESREIFILWAGPMSPVYLPVDLGNGRLRIIREKVYSRIEFFPVGSYHRTCMLKIYFSTVVSCTIGFRSLSPLRSFLRGTDREAKLAAAVLVEIGWARTYWPLSNLLSI